MDLFAYGFILSLIRKVFYNNINPRYIISHYNLLLYVYIILYVQLYTYNVANIFSKI